jgi:serine protease inhibitor
MKRKLRYAAVILLLLPLLGCSDIGRTGPGNSDPPQPVPMGPLTAAEKAIVNSGNTFGFKLFVSLNKTSAGQNLFVCPLSVSMALGMTLNGAKGPTRDAMQATLGFAGMTQQDINRSYQGLSALLTGLDPKVRMQIANSIWYRPALIVEDTFKNVNMTYFNAEVNSIDFTNPSAALTINGWVDRNTNGRITQVVQPPIPDGIMMYLINAVYFKGSWTYRYDTKETKDDFFTLSDGSKSSCKMMAQKDTVPYFMQNGVQVIDLPYGNAGFSMTVILPPPGVDIDGFVSSLTQEQWNLWTAHLEKKEVSVYMPKFRITWRESLKDVLSNMGMAVAFSDGADFTGIDRRGSLAVSDVVHVTFVQVDEEGTEAAGVTVVGVTVTSVGAGPIVMRLDRPFIYALRENQSGTILFIGKLAIPGW